MVMEYPNPWFERSSHSGHLWNQAWNLKRFSCLCPWSFSSYASSAQQWTCPSLLLATRQEEKNGLITGEKNTVWVGILLMFVFLVVLKCFWWYTNFLTVSECFLEILWRGVVENMGSWARSQKSGVGLTGLLPVVRCETQLAALVAKMVAAILGKNFGNGWRRNSDLMWSVFAIG